MTTLSRYHVSRILPPFGVAVTVVLMALSLERLLRIVEKITAQGAPVGRAFEMLGYLVPHYLALAIPAAVFLAVLMSTRRLQTSDELAAMQAAGVPIWRLLRPVLGIALVLGAILAANGWYVQPHARYAFKARMHQITDEAVSLRLQPGVFQPLGQDIVVRADAVSQGGRDLRGFFAVVEKDKGGRNVITASAARLKPDREDRGLAVELRDGTIVREGPDAPPGSVNFDSYVWKPPTDVIAPYGPRGHNEQELTVLELFSENAESLARGTGAAAIAAERHLRLIRPLSLPVLAVLAVPLALLGSGRTGHAYGFVLGVALVIFYEKLIGFGEAFAKEDQMPAWLALWTPYAALTVLTAVLFWYRAEYTGRAPSLFRRIYAILPGAAKTGAEAEAKRT